MKTKNQTTKRFARLNIVLSGFIFCGFFNPCHAQVSIGGINVGNLADYHMVFTKANADANWQGATKGFCGNVAINGIVATERTSGSVPFAGTIYTNDATLNSWNQIVNSNAGQALSSLNNTSLLNGLSSDLENTFSQINAMPVTPGFSGRSAISLNGLNTQNHKAEIFVINITSGFTVSTQIRITGDASDVFIFRWDTDANFRNGYNGQVKFQSGGAIVPLGKLKASNFIHVAGDISSSGGGSNPALPFPQGPRSKNGKGPLIRNGSDFTGGGFFTGYWFTTGSPTIFQAGFQPYGQTSPLSNAIFVGGWYSKTTQFSMTSGTSGVYVEPNGSIGNRIWSDADGNGTQEDGEPGIGNVNVKLYSSSGEFIDSTRSDSVGYYLFSGVSSGTYYLQFIAPAGNEFTLPIQNDDTTLDSDADPETGLTKCLTLKAGATDTTRDAGFNRNASIGNFVWNDLNANGIQDQGEPGIVNVIVELHDCSGNFIWSTITDYNGLYLFSNIEPGNYSITFILPDDFIFSPIHQGLNHAKDSDPAPANGIASCVTLHAGDYNATVDAGLIGRRSLRNMASDKNNIPIQNINQVEARSFPNPFIATTTIEFRSDKDSPLASVEIYSLDGRKITDLFHASIEANTTYNVTWEAANVPNGIYLYKIICDEKVTTGRMILLK